MTKPSGEATPRRQFLRTIVLAPAAAAVGGCATPRAAAPPDETAAPPPAAPGAAAAGEDPALHALRSVPLELTAEPALVFRAAPARPGE